MAEEETAEPEVEVDEGLREAFAADDENNVQGKDRYILRERYEIDFSSPIPELDNNSAKAYKVIDKIDVQRQLFVLVCDTLTAPRSSLMGYLKSMEHSALMRVVEYGAVINPLENANKWGIVYQRPLGGRVDVGDLDLTDQVVFRDVALRLLGVAEQFKGSGLTHRAIRADNLYYRDAGRREIVVGDCLASFPGFHQPPAFETIENLAAQPEGRGNGSSDCDFYSVGAVLMCLYFKTNLLENLSAPEMLRLKAKNGSYAALLDDSAMPNFFSHILRGLLDDNPLYRWTYLQAYNYLDSKSPNIAPHVERPKKSIVINNEKLYSTRDVVLAMGASVSEAYDLIKSGKLLAWIRNNMEEATADKIEKFAASALTAAMRYDILVARVGIMIYPDLPIRIRGLSVFPDGAPKAIFFAIRQSHDMTPFYDLFSFDLVKAWYQEQPSLRAPAGANDFHMFINNTSIGYGIDRIMYDSDKDLPCISPLLGSNFVNSATKILKALDRKYTAAMAAVPPYDNTLIAYLRCKLGNTVNPLVSNLSSPRDEIRAVTILKLYTMLQKKYGPPKVPNLSIWLSSFSKPLIDSYHNLKYRKYLERELVKVSSQGKIYNIIDLLENNEARKKDLTEYNDQTKEVARLLAEKARLSGNSKALNDEAREVGLNLSAVLAIAVMVVSFTVNLFRLIMEN